MLVWVDGLPNLLIGFREGLEAGLVVSILLAALRKTDAGRRTWPVWLGVLGAVSVSGSFAAVLTFSTSSLGSTAQQAVGGILSLVAIALVTLMIFWMRRTARLLSGELTHQVGEAIVLGAGALAVTAFMAVGREGLETTLFIWAAAQAAGTTAAPVVGAFVGVGLAVLVCWLIFRGALRLDLGVFFSRTAIVLIVIAAGVLAYGLGDLQDAGLLPGGRWVAFDVSGQGWSSSWWATLIQGLTQLRPRMSVLQVVAWVAYLAVVLGWFIREGRHAPAPKAASTTAATDAAPHRTPTWLRWAERRVWLVAAGLVVVPALVATAVIVALPAQTGGTTAVEVSATACGTGWSSGTSGTRTFSVSNTGSKPGEITLLNQGDAIVGEIETLGPATTAPMTATLGDGGYHFHCVYAGQSPVDGAPVTVSGSAVTDATTAIRPVTVAELTPPNHAYQAYAAGRLTTLSAQLETLRTAVAEGDTAAAKDDWLAAMMTWEEVGASYDSFGDLGEAVDALPIQFEDGVADPGFTGLHRVEYDLWHGVAPATALADVGTTASAVAKVAADLGSDDLAGDPTNLTLRVHEILEDALRDHLTGIDDNGAGASYAMTYADVQVDRVVLGELAPLLTERSPRLVATARSELTALQDALLALQRPDGSWLSIGETSLAQRQRVDAAIGAALETLSAAPDLLEVPPSQQ